MCECVCMWGFVFPLSLLAAAGLVERSQNEEAGRASAEISGGGARRGDGRGDGDRTVRLDKGRSGKPKSGCCAK